MTREQAKQNLIGFGIAEPTDEQISSYLNQIGGETKKEKDRADGYKKDAEKSIELQKQLDAINAQNLSDIDREKAETQKALDTIANLQKELSRMKLAKNLSDKGIVGEDAEGILKAVESGDFTAMVESFGSIISAREVASASAKEAELLKKTPTPGMGGGTGADGKSDAEKLVMNIIASDKASAPSGDILSHYINN